MTCKYHLRIVMVELLSSNLFGQNNKSMPSVSIGATSNLPGTRCFVAHPVGNRVAMIWRKSLHANLQALALLFFFKVGLYSILFCCALVFPDLIFIWLVGWSWERNPIFKLIFHKVQGSNKEFNWLTIIMNRKCKVSHFLDLFLFSICTRYKLTAEFVSCTSLPTFSDWCVYCRRTHHSYYT